MDAVWGPEVRGKLKGLAMGGVCVWEGDSCRFH
jgi:hypothetical protein